MLVTRLPNRSTRTTSPTSAARSSRGSGIVELQPFAVGRPIAVGSVPLRQPAGGGREAIAALECSADRRPRIAPLGQLDDPLRLVLAQDRGQHAVVGRHEPVIARVGDQPAAGRSHAGIDDDEEDGAGGKYLYAGRELERARQHVVRRNVVA